MNYFYILLVAAVLSAQAMPHQLTINTKCTGDKDAHQCPIYKLAKLRTEEGQWLSRPPERIGSGAQIKADSDTYISRSGRGPIFTMTYELDTDDGSGSSLTIEGAFPAEKKGEKPSVTVTGAGRTQAKASCSMGCDGSSATSFWEIEHFCED